MVVRARAQRVIVRDGAARGVEATTWEGKRVTVRVKGGVILASGGFNRHATRRAELMPGVSPEWSPCAPGNTGAAHDLAAAVGAHYGEGAASNGIWAPVSLRTRPDGSHAVFPHFVMDRGKPGMIVVNQQGRRFLNEASSYQVFGIAMQEANKKTPCIPGYLITDAAGLRRYGMGMVRPGGKGLQPFLDDGYLVQSNTLAELASKLDIVCAGANGEARLGGRGRAPPRHRRRPLHHRRRGAALDARHRHDPV